MKLAENPYPDPYAIPQKYHTWSDASLKNKRIGFEEGCQAQDPISRREELEKRINDLRERAKHGSNHDRVLLRRIADEWEGVKE